MNHSYKQTKNPIKQQQKTIQSNSKTRLKAYLLGTKICIVFV